MNPWDQIKQQLEATLNTEAYQNWVSRSVFRQMAGGVLHVSVPNVESKAWLETEYADHVMSAIRKLTLPVQTVLYEFASTSRQQNGVDGERDEPESPVSQLNPRFTFDTFVVGACNQFAHAAARSVATNPSRSYNPLFLYGGVGMGKTHLMHAIGRALMTNSGGMRIIYTSSERFTNEVVSGIRTERMPQLRQRYRSADVLLIDDIQLLGNKERTQEEFFHTFNELHDHQKQLVISSDSPPKDIPGLLERLRSRFEWGLMVDIQPPDLETKMAILDKKAEMEGLALPEDVRIYIATKTKSNVRELEGALIKLIAYSSVTASPITLAMAQQTLKHLIPGQERRVTMDSVLRAVAERFQMQPAQLK